MGASPIRNILHLRSNDIDLRHAAALQAEINLFSIVQRH